MSTAAESKIKGKLNVAAGKVKQSVGEATHDNKVANEGVAQQVKGNAQQAWGAVKEAVNDASTRARANESRAYESRAHESTERRENENEHKAHDVRESIASTAQNVKNHIQDSVADYRAKHAK